MVGQDLTNPEDVMRDSAGSLETSQGGARSFSFWTNNNTILIRDQIHKSIYTNSINKSKPQIIFYTRFYFQTI